MKQQKWVTGIWPSLVFLATCTLGGSAQADEYDTMREKWRIRMSGGPAVNFADADVAKMLEKNSQSALALWKSMDRSPARSALWADVADWSRSSSMRLSYTRLATLALAYGTVGNSLYANTSLRDDIINGLDWLYATHYNPNTVAFDNWWDWQIGAPLQLTNCMALLYADLGATRLANYISVIDKFVPDPTRRLKHDGSFQPTQETGANRTDKALAVAMRGMLGKSAAKLAQARDALSQTLPEVTAGDGFYADGSFVQHDTVAYTAGYGGVLIDGWSKLHLLLNGTSWTVTDPKLPNLYQWVYRSFRPLIYDGAFMDMVKGRGISREQVNDHIATRPVIVAMMRLAESAPPSDARKLRGIAKGWIQRDTFFGDNFFSSSNPALAGSLNSLPLYEMGLMKKMMKDDNISALPEPDETHVFASMDRVVLRHPGVAIALSLFSDRISAFEYGNGENLNGWWTGMGMMNIYNADHGQYDHHFWPTVDMRRLAGTTTDRSGKGTPRSFSHYPNTSSWAGGVALNYRFAATGMEFTIAQVTGTTLGGKKAWFLFDDKIMAVGADIASTDGVLVETIVENRKLNTEGSNLLTVNNVAKPNALGWNESMVSVSWAHLAGNVPGSDIGYYFPGTATVNALREQRSGAWQQINTGERATTVSNAFLSLAVPHGVNPTAGKYSYVVLPKRTAAQTAAFASSPSIALLAQSGAVFAARDLSQGVTGATFWTDAPTTLSLQGTPFLTVNKKAAVVVRESAGTLQLAVSDPTQKNAGTIEIEIHRQVTKLLSANPGVTVLQLQPTIKLSVNVNASAGQSREAQFSMPN
jgi:hyaluronate lyase